MKTTIEIDESHKQFVDLIKPLFLGEYLADKDIKYMVQQLTSLYRDGFRHRYANFYTLMVRNAENIGDESTADNIQALLEFIQSAENQEIMNDEKVMLSFEKLIDHLNIEIGRFSDASNYQVELENFDKKLKESKNELNNLKNNLMKATEQASGMQIQLISMLSIFAAIVITFSGGINFIAGALSGMANTSIFKGLIFVLVCGIMLFNTIFVLMYSVCKIIDKNLYVACESEKCDCMHKGKNKCSVITKLRKRLPYVFWFNYLLMVFIVIDLILWYLWLK